MTGGVHMPALSGASAWINSAPQEPADLRGHVVLVDFWTLTCINWLRTEPYVRAWSQAYRGDGLIVIGVHTPEFSFEHEVELVRQATRERDIDYPVVVDSDYAIWTAFDNHYWPALYFVDAQGRIRHHKFGEGESGRGIAGIPPILLGSPAVVDPCHSGVIAAILIEAVVVLLVPNFDGVPSHHLSERNGSVLGLVDKGIELRSAHVRERRRSSRSDSGNVEYRRNLIGGPRRIIHDQRIETPGGGVDVRIRL